MRPSAGRWSSAESCRASWCPCAAWPPSWGLWIEPELTARAAPHAEAAFIKSLKAIDVRLDATLAAGDVDGYMTANHAFHFAVCERAEAEVLLSMARGLWLQIGPFLRVVFGRAGTVGLAADRYAEAMHALKAGDSEAARRAIAADLSDGMDRMCAAVGG
ncbi:GntR family transcriptional regulator [Caulobacter sp. DWR2-3-1b2]|uniref:GntR family transcriptional regulator n=1 Tax=Caulobacter sp. DWR2-3-1b2 TaxID=2804642 RepID=UPI003CF1633D